MQLPSIRAAALAATLMSIGFAASACSSSFGGGGSAPRDGTVVLPPGSRVVCADGTNPPCH